MRDHLQALAKRRPNHPEVARLKISWPHRGLELWRHYCNIARPPSMAGLAQKTSAEILAYQALEQISFNHWELAILRMLDRIVINEANKKDNA